MSSSATTGAPADLARKAFAKAERDEDFRKLLKDNPREAARQLGIPIPDNVRVEVVDKDEDVMYLVRPSSPVTAKVSPGCPLDCSMCSLYCWSGSSS